MSNREIKFRVWDKKENKFVSRDDLKINLATDGSIYFASLADNKKLNTDVETQQFTGLKDKNEREIYEGDLIKIDSNDKNYHIYFEGGQLMIKTSKYRPSNLVWALGCQFGTDSYNECGLSEVMEELEVVGNIFENPELLNN